MSEQEPEAEDRLGKNVKDSIGNDFGVDGGNSRSIGYTPDTMMR